MAWSDAARRAAAEVRRRHAQERASMRSLAPGETRSITTFEGDSLRSRKRFADTLRAMRRNPSYGYAGVSRSDSVLKASRVAAASTRLRNDIRRGTYKRPVYYDTGGRGASFAADLQAKRLRGISWRGR